MNAKPQAIPPKATTSPSLAFFAGTVIALAVLISGAVLFFFNPSQYGFYPVCLFHKVTGLNCPGCGGTRAAYQLLHGHLLLALRDNALFVLTLAALAGRGAWFAVRKLRQQPAALGVSPKMLWAYLVFIVAFSLLRNLPSFAFLSP
jgi:hypothetical protein